ncbi:hypothetical protein BRADI_3g51532v3 [Brachypodium distachyon]|uniref:Uncharacterized protein n=1 Tax=Brachypodium distachyon TaxID=15368 RepID=A0A2K2D4L6_BRADI|nr:hypothetical protein BRADI_3g51532v3 [Brachypodium distachyon]
MSARAPPLVPSPGDAPPPCARIFGAAPPPPRRSPTSPFPCTPCSDAAFPPVRCVPAPPLPSTPCSGVAPPSCTQSSSGPSRAVVGGRNSGEEDADSIGELNIQTEIWN